MCTARENEALSRPEDSKAVRSAMEVGRSGREDLRLRAFILWVKQRAWRTGRGLIASRVAVQGGPAAWPCPWGACHPGLQGTRMHERTSPSPLPSSVPGTLHKYNRTARLGIFSLEKRRSSLGRFVGKSEMNSL